MNNPKKTFKVTGRGNFPLDMLRYEDCHFASIPDEDKAFNNGDFRTIELVYHSTRDQWKPTPSRWNVYSWIVEGDTNHVSWLKKTRLIGEALADIYEINGVGTILSEDGADFNPVRGHNPVCGYELANRIMLAKRRIETLKKGIAGCEKLLATVPTEVA